MQIMPSTADHLGLPRNKIYDPEANISAAAKYMNELMGYFSDIPAHGERIYFALACYNGGYHHVRDAMALAQKNGRNPKRWADVAEFVLKLREPEYYNDPVVKHGYMRGNETVDYVEKIRARWADYRGVARPHGIVKGSGVGGRAPQKAKRKYRFHV
jgi:membrane-bound lytic murein transglycosylase F